MNKTSTAYYCEGCGNFFDTERFPPARLPVIVAKPDGDRAVEILLCPDDRQRFKETGTFSSAEARRVETV